MVLYDEGTKLLKGIGNYERDLKIKFPQKYRIAIARAVIRNKCILVIDEGTTGLDSDTADSIMNNLFDMPCTVIMITHDIHGKYISRFNKKYKLLDGCIECIQ